MTEQEFIARARRLYREYREAVRDVRPMSITHDDITSDYAADALELCAEAWRSEVARSPLMPGHTHTANPGALCLECQRLSREQS
jgi:hypothetical protein